MAAPGAQKGGDAADDNIRPRRAPSRAAVVAAAGAAVALALAAAVAAADSGQTEGRRGPALAGGPRGRVPFPLVGRAPAAAGQTAPSIPPRAAVAAGDPDREKLGSGQRRVGPRTPVLPRRGRNPLPACRLSSGYAPDFRTYRMAKH